ncbi:MAG TPA: ligase-associated DNA damage response exonuclease [Paracoccaceae bacterium]|nr:ligase-associated DNA damage response exonuclease [Paracoccaceae bacterium]
MRPQDLLRPEAGGIFCPAGGFYIDPGRAVARAVVTHGHGDHCRPGHEALLATPETAVIARARYGTDAYRAVETLDYGQPLRIGDVTVTLVPAGHVLGSAQVVVEAGAARVVVSGDYKRQADPTCRPFEPVACDLFVTEATFGLPVFRHPPVGQEIGRLLASVRRFPERCHVVGAYALGKAQRLIAELRRAGWERPIWLHGALAKLCETYEGLGVPLGPLEAATGALAGQLRGEIVIAPPGALNDRWMRRMPDSLPVAASGWMRVRQRARQRGVELALVISDHADWDELTATVRETGAAEVWVTHGAEEALIHWCRTQGTPARALHLVGRGEEGEA